MTQPLTPSQKLMDWLKKDIFVIIVLGFSLIALLYTVGSVNTYQERINDHWWRQYEQSPCWKQSGQIPVEANMSFEMWRDYNDTA